MATPLLTICVYSYNRGERLKTLVSYLAPVVAEMGGEVELFVSNNQSTDHTESLISEMSYPHFSFKTQPAHLPTGEEHMYAALNDCTGEFVWFLGDDDIPTLSTVRALPNILQSNPEIDFVIFNSILGDGVGGVAGGRMAWMHGDRFEAEFANGATALGFTSNLPGISNSIFRRDPAARAPWRDLVALSPIYSHVVWWFRAFKGRRMAIVNRILVRYRVDASASLGRHFEDFAEKNCVGDRYFWTLGLIRLLTELEKEGALPAEVIREIWEFRADMSYYPLLDNMFYLFFDQVERGAASERNRLTEAEFTEALDWFLRMDPGYFEASLMLRMAHSGYRLADLADIEHRMKWTRADFNALMAHKNGTHRFRGLLETYGGFDIYAHKFATVAFHEASPVERQRILRHIDPQPIEGEVIVGKSIDDVKEQIHAHVSLSRELLRRKLYGEPSVVRS